MNKKSLIPVRFAQGLAMHLMAVLAAAAMHSVPANAENSLDAQRAMAKAIHAADIGTITGLLGQGFDPRGEILGTLRSAFWLTLVKRDDLRPFLAVAKALPTIEEIDLEDAVRFGGSLHALTLIPMRADWPADVLEAAVVLAFTAYSDESARVILESVYLRAIGSPEPTLKSERRPPDPAVINALIKAGASEQSALDAAVGHGDPALVERFVYGSTVRVQGGTALTHALRRDDRRLADHLIGRGASLLSIQVPREASDAYPDPEYILSNLLRDQLLSLDPKHKSLEVFRLQQPAPIKGRLSGAVQDAPLDFSLSFGKTPYFGNTVTLKSVAMFVAGNLITPEKNYSLYWNSPAGATYEILVEIPAVPLPDAKNPFPRRYYDVVLENITERAPADLKFREVPWEISQNGLKPIPLPTGKRVPINLANGSLRVRAVFGDGWEKGALTALSIIVPNQSHGKLPETVAPPATRLKYYLELANRKYANENHPSQLVLNNNKTTIHLFSEQLYESGIYKHLDGQLVELARAIGGQDVILGHLLQFLVEFDKLDDYTIPDLLQLSPQTPAELQGLIRQLNDQSADASKILSLLRDTLVTAHKRQLERFQALLMERAQYMDPDQNIDTLARQNIDTDPGVDAARLHKHLAAVPSLHLPAPGDLNGQGARLLNYLNNR